MSQMTMMRLLAGAGAAAPWTPMTIAGCTGWWDPSDTATITSSGGLVSQLADKTTYARRLVQATGDRQPKTATHTINSLNVLEYFSGGSNRVHLATPAAQFVNASTGEFTIFAVWQASSVSGTYRAVADFDTEGGSRGTQAIRLSPSATQQAVRIAGGVVTDASGTTLSSSTVYVSSTRQSTSAVETYVSGATDGASAISNPSASGTLPLYVGIHGDGASYPFYGDIGEVIVYDSSLSAADHNTVGNYLATKWGTTWTTVT